MEPSIDRSTVGERLDPAPHKARALGYASLPQGRTIGDPEFGAQVEAMELACSSRDLLLVELVADLEERPGSDLERPGLTHALERIEAGDASCLIVSALERLTRSVAELGTLAKWLESHRARVIVLDLDLDTATPDGAMAARALAAVGDLERERLALPRRGGSSTTPGMKGSAGRPDTPHGPELEERIRAMRAEGMTLQAIADALNAEGIPTLRGAAKWRPSSVHAATGYKRPRRRRTPNRVHTDR
jgi:DNA invertase Pin-like site-specific DNA recombinase